MFDLRLCKNKNVLKEYAVWVTDIPVAYEGVNK